MQAEAVEKVNVAVATLICSLQLCEYPHSSRSLMQQPQQEVPEAELGEPEDDDGQFIDDSANNNDDDETGSQQQLAQKGPSAEAIISSTIPSTADWRSLRACISCKLVLFMF